MEFNNFQEYIIAKHLESSLVEEIKELCPEDKRAIENLILELKPSANNLREFYQLTKEICHREKINIAKLLQEKCFAEFLDSSSNLSPKDKLKKIKFALEARRFPETEVIKNKINQGLKEITKKYNLKLRPPENLEGDTFSLNLNFNSKEQLRTLVAKLDSLSQDKSLEEVFSTLKGEL